MRTVQISDVAAGGAVGTAATTVDIAGVLEINQTTANKVLTLPTPTNTSFARQVDVANTGTAAFFMYGRMVRAGASEEFLYVAGVGWRRKHSSAQIIAQSAVGATAPANDTNENTLATVVIPGGVLGANGALRVALMVAQTSNANVKTYRVKLDSTTFQAPGAASTAGGGWICEIANRNDQASQYARTLAATGSLTGASTATGTVNTANDQTLVITAQKATGTDTMTLEGYTIELLRFD